MNGETIKCKLRDMGSNDGSMSDIEVTVTVNDQGVFIGFSGYGEKTSADGAGQPVMIEVNQGKPTCYVWSDINIEDPTYVISLENAAESNRNPE